MLLGDHTREALNGAACAVAVSPAGYAERPVALLEIGVGYDGSPESEHALAVARELAKVLGAKVSAFEAVSLPLDGRGPGEAIGEFVDAARQRIAALAMSNRMPHTAPRPRSSRCTAPRSTYSSSARAGTVRSAA